MVRMERSKDTPHHVHVHVHVLMCERDEERECECICVCFVPLVWERDASLGLLNSRMCVRVCACVPPSHRRHHHRALT